MTNVRREKQNLCECLESRIKRSGLCVCMHTSSFTFRGREDGNEEILFVNYTLIKLGGEKEKKATEKKEESWGPGWRFS